MTTKNILSLIFIFALALTSCKKELEPQESSPTTALTPPTENAAPVTPQAPQTQTMTAPQPTQAPRPAQPVQVAAGMNPAHGQPGHRCDIAVGAPLNSPPGNTAQKITPKQNMPMAAAPNQANTPAILNPSAVATAPGMNPPHGQEGHRCDVAVGAALPKA